MRRLVRNAAILGLSVALYPLVDRFATFSVHDTGVVVITGATSGLGQDAAYHLARDLGYTVLAGALSTASADALQADALAQGVPEARFKAIVLDVADASHFAPAVDAARAAMTRAKVPFVGLVNNAGVNDDQLYRRDNQSLPTLELYRRLFEVNLFAPVALVEAFDSLLRESKGRVVNVGSVAGEVSVNMGTGPHGAYSASKFALRSANDAMRRAYKGSGVSVSLVAPGYVLSQMCDPATRKQCARLGPGETTTPAYVDALLSPRPRTKYLCAHIGGGFSASVWIPLLSVLPDRLLDWLLYAV